MNLIKDSLARKQWRAVVLAKKVPLLIRIIKYVQQGASSINISMHCSINMNVF